MNASTVQPLFLNNNQCSVASANRWSVSLDLLRRRPLGCEANRPSTILFLSVLYGCSCHVTSPGALFNFCDRIFKCIIIWPFSFSGVYNSRPFSFIWPSPGALLDGESHACRERIRMHVGEGSLRSNNSGVRRDKG